MARKSSRNKFEVDTFAKAQAVLDAKAIGRKAEDQLKYMFNEHPELIECTHEHIGQVMLLQRETVTRALLKLKRSRWRVGMMALLLVLLFNAPSMADVTYTITSLTTGSTYSFWVTCYDSAGNESDYSNVISKTITNGQVRISWRQPTTYMDDTAIEGFRGYKAYYSLTSGGTTTTIDIGQIRGPLQGIGIGQRILMPGPSKAVSDIR